MMFGGGRRERGRVESWERFREGGRQGGRMGGREWRKQREGREWREGRGEWCLREGVGREGRLGREWEGEGHGR